MAPLTPLVILSQISYPDRMDANNLENLTADELMRLASRLKHDNDILERLAGYGEMLSAMAEKGRFDIGTLDQIHTDIMALDQLDSVGEDLRTSILQAIAAIRA